MCLIMSLQALYQFIMNAPASASIACSLLLINLGANQTSYSTSPASFFPSVLCRVAELEGYFILDISLSQFQALV